MSCVSCDLTAVSRRHWLLLEYSMAGKITVSNLLSDPPIHRSLNLNCNHFYFYLSLYISFFVISQAANQSVSGLFKILISLCNNNNDLL